MKNRKLFAIITLVAFMLTMMPLMAFATSASSSSISVDVSNGKVTTATSTGKALEFILDLDDVVGENQNVVIFAERNGSLSDSDTITVEKEGAVVNDAVAKEHKGYFVLSKTTGNKAGEYTVKVNSTSAGTVTMKAYVVKGAGEINDNEIAKIYNGSSDIIKTAFVGNGCTGKFNTVNSDIDFVTTVDGTTLKSIEDADAESTKVDPTVTKISANNGATGGTAKFNVKVTKGATKAVGEKVTVSIDKSGASVNEEELTTSATGKVEFKVTATKPGDYKVTVECGNHSETYKVTATDTGIAKINITYSVKDTIAVDNKTTTALMLAAYDNNGNLLDPAKVGANANGVTTLGDADQWKVKVEKAPADSSLEDQGLEFKYDRQTCDNLFVSFTPDAAGEYTIKVFNDSNGVTARATIKAAEFGTADHATLSYASAVYSLGETTPVGIVDLYDQNGVKKSVSAKKFSYTGLGVAKFDAANGQVTFKSDSDYTGKEVTVSVVVNSKFSASTTLTIAAEPAALKFTDATAEVGTEASAKLQVVDVNGNNSAISFPGGYTVEVQSAIITEKPEGATTSVDAGAIESNKETFLKKGTSTVKIASNKEGTVKANVVVKLTAINDVIRDGVTYTADGTHNYTFFLSGVATANFGAKAPEKGTGDTVTFIIGNTTFVANGATKAADVAPYVANGRTFIPVRAFAEATGAKVEYDAATQVITITGEGLSAQMTIGSNILTVNGQTTVMDTAAAVTAEGRTVLPVRFAGQALGYGFEVAYGANGAVSSVTMFK